LEEVSKTIRIILANGSCTRRQQKAKEDRGKGRGQRSVSLGGGNEKKPKGRLRSQSVQSSSQRPWWITVKLRGRVRGRGITENALNLFGYIRIGDKGGP